MKKILINIFFLSLFVNGYCQDTIYSTIYPKGIVTNAIRKKMNNYVFQPINNQSLKIILKEKNIFKIKYFNGETFINSQIPITDKKDIILPTEQLTASLVYTDIIEVKEAKSMKLYNSLKKLTQIPIQTVYTKAPDIVYTLITSDTIDSKNQQYIGAFNSASPYIVYFQLELKFKDGKIKYNYSNFIAIYEKAIGNQSITSQTQSSFFNPQKLTTYYSYQDNTGIETHLLKIDHLYADQDLTDVARFWKPISKNIAESIEYLKKLAIEQPKIKKDDW